MKDDVDLARETAAWLKQGSRPLPARVLDGTMSAVSRTRQLSPAHPRWTVRLARAAALGAAAAAVVMAVAYGPLLADRAGGLLPPPAGPSADASPSPDATVSPAPTPSPSVSPSPSASPSPAPAGKIAFFSDRDGKTEIYVMNADGSGQTNVSHGPGDFGPGLWSPDGSRIAFTSDRDGNLNVYVVNADGSGLTNLGNAGPIINGGVVGCAPSDPPIRGYDPDAAHVAFVNGFGDGKGEELFVMNADGSGVTRLTNNAVDDHNLVWSPDSSRIAWHRSIAGNTEIWVVNPDGSGLTRLSNGPEGDALRDGGWSPDGSRIAFDSSRDGNGEIYLVNADGSGLTNLTNNPGQDNGPVWSPAR